MHVVAYLRVSTEEQRLGPEAQRAEIEAWAARNGATVVAWHVDQGVSGTAEIADRPALIAALSSVREHRAAVLVVAKRDRLARDVVVAGLIERELARMGAAVRSADGAGDGEGPEARLMASILDAFAAFEAGKIRARTKAALAAKRAKGEKLGGRAPYGFRLGEDGVHLVADAGEQATIALVRELAETGYSQRAIVADLAARGIVGRTGRPLAQPQVHRLIRAA